MMGRNHIKQGACAALIAGVGTVSLGVWRFDPVDADAGRFASLPDPMPALLGLVFLAAVPVIAVELVLGGSVAPDVDSKGSTATRVYGPLSWLVSLVVRAVTRAVYTLTRGRRDTKKDGAHRLLTHTAIGNALSGLALAGVCSIDTGYGPLPAAIALGGVGGLGAYALKKRWRWQVALVTGVVAYHLPGVNSTWLWLWGVAFALGCAVHCFGDSCTLSGTPWFWPIGRKGKRWNAGHVLPRGLRVRTGKTGESVAMFFTFALTAGACVALVFLGSWLSG